MAELTPDTLKQLNELVEQEMTRRNGYGSLADYTGADYQFTNEPKTGEFILAEHGSKVVDRLLMIQDHGDLELVQQGKAIPSSFSDELITYVNELKTESMTGSTSSCRGACTGLCVGTCTGTCSGCSNQCTGCKTGCSSSCSGCTGTCGSGCASGCRY